VDRLTERLTLSEADATGRAQPTSTPAGLRSGPVAEAARPPGITVTKAAVSSYRCKSGCNSGGRRCGSRRLMVGARSDEWGSPGEESGTGL